MNFRIDYRLPKAQRLLQLSEFNAVYSKGTAYHHRFFVLFVLKMSPLSETTSLPPVETTIRQVELVAGKKVGGAFGQTQGSAPNRRVGIVAGKKVGGAVKRNRAKRLLREAYRLNKNKLIQGLDIVLVAKKMLPDLTFHEVEKNLLYIFKKANILNTEHR